MKFLNPATDVLILQFLLSLPVNCFAREDTLTDASIAVTGTQFQMIDHTINGGYAVMSGSQFTLQGIVGQPDTGISQSSNTVFVGGFLTTDSPLFSDIIFVDGFDHTP